MADKPGWIVFTESIGHDPLHMGGRDYRQWSNQGFSIIVRLNNGYFPHGTISERKDYGDFAKRCGNFVRASIGCTHWIIGNEPNHEQERPSGQVITAADYAECFNVCANEIHEALPHHQAIVAAIAPWNVQSGDWLNYYEAVLRAVIGADGIALHTYTHGPDPALITSEQTMDAPYTDRRYHFRAYRDFMRYVPSKFEFLPFYITETNQGDGPWANIDSAWVQAAYQEINDWNYDGADCRIHALCLYRWPNYDQWGINGKQGVIADFRAAVTMGYSVPTGEEPPTMPEWKRIYYNDCEQYHDQGGAPELTIPVGSTLHYRHFGAGHFPRPEMDHKRTADGQTEVFNPPGASATGFYISADGQFAWVFDKITVTAGDKLRAYCAYMHIAREGGQNGACGGRIGLVLGDSPFDLGMTAWPLDGQNPFEHESIQWGPWRSSYTNNPDYLKDRTWAKLETGEIPHGVTSVRAIVMFTSNVRQTVHGFIDDVTIEMYTDGDVTPPPVDPPTPTECKFVDRTGEILAAIAELRAAVLKHGDTVTL